MSICGTFSHLRMSIFNTGVSELDVGSVISLSDFPLVNLTHFSINTSKAVPVLVMWKLSFVI